MVKRILGLSLLMVAGLVGCGGPDVGPSSAELDIAQEQPNCCYLKDVCKSRPFYHYGACAQVVSPINPGLAAYGSGGCENHRWPGNELYYSQCVQWE